MIRRHTGPALNESVPAAITGRIELAEMLHSPRLWAPFLNSYILLASMQRVRTVGRHTANRDAKIGATGLRRSFAHAYNFRS